ncbi:MAG: FAD-binding protein [Candidatus Tectomicrobia bacterium]|uniref:FAD-binding protein n=1 Tax=Tectimicrobiota bacterium TaxID=2528274 RepID=A0A937VXT1_UNCTE|nr:FAD-binding protein [Candidatus Tectomicrobia bacterium]
MTHSGEPQVTSAFGPGALGVGIGDMPDHWDLVADIVVIGAGATGLPAAIAARDAGASVIVVEANYDIGGHAILSGGNVPLGGGTSAQRKYGIADSPALVFADLTDWTIVQPNGWPDYRYNDRAVMRAFADHAAEAYEFLVANGVRFKDVPPDTVARYNTFVDTDVDTDFGKPRPQYKLQTPPFYATWSTPLVHDTRAGLRINAQCQVVDMDGQVILGLYCGGESAGGFNQHGLGRCTAQGYMAGKYAALERP